MKQPSKINVLIACEESQRECIAFRQRGFNAFSCDIQKCSGKHPEWHIQSDVTTILPGSCSFQTQDGQQHSISGHWNLIIAHPPCTYLCKVSSVRMFNGDIINRERLKKMILARDFFLTCLHAPADYLAVENPLPMAIAVLPPPTTFISPSDFGYKYRKKTLYWLRNLPPLMPTIINPNPKDLVKSSRGKYRSRTAEPLAEAIAEQWGIFILDDFSSAAQ